MRSKMSPVFRQVIDIYDALPNKPLEISNETPGYVQLSAEGWFKGLHYEFLDMTDYLTVEMHIEVKRAYKLVDVLQSWVGVGTDSNSVNPLLQDILNTDDICVSQPWLNEPKFSRLIANYHDYDDPKRVAEAMARFIHATQHKITTWLQEKNLLKNVV